MCFCSILTGNQKALCVNLQQPGESIHCAYREGKAILKGERGTSHWFVLMLWTCNYPFWVKKIYCYTKIIVKQKYLMCEMLNVLNREYQDWWPSLWSNFQPPLNIIFNQLIYTGTVLCLSACPCISLSLFHLVIIICYIASIIQIFLHVNFTFNLHI